MSVLIEYLLCVNFLTSDPITPAGCEYCIGRSPELTLCLFQEAIKDAVLLSSTEMCLRKRIREEMIECLHMFIHEPREAFLEAAALSSFQKKKKKTF